MLSRERVVGVLVAAVVLGGCSASPASNSPTTTQPSMSSSGTLAAGVPLRALGVINGPAEFRLPAAVRPTRTIDQPNVVTLFFAASSGHSLADYLVAELPTMGFRVDAAKDGSVVFSGTEWSGSFTTDDQISALTLRRN